MQAFLEGGSSKSRPPDLQDAIIVLEHLSGEGNKVARQRLNDVKEFSNQVLLSGEGTAHNALASQHQRDRSRDESEPSNAERPPPSASEVSPTQTQRFPGRARGSEEGLAGSVAAEADAATSFSEVDIIGNVDSNLDWEMAGIFSSFHDPRLPVTGVDQIDWEEMERMFATRDP